MQVDVDRLIDELCYTSYVMNTTNSKYSFGANFNGFIGLNEVSGYNFGIKAESKFLNRQNRMIEHLNSFNRSIYDFYVFLIKNKDILYETFGKLSRYYNRIHFNDVKFYNVIRSYSEKDFKDIILGFYSTFNDKYYNIAKKYFDEQRINLPSCTYDGASGNFFSLPCLESGYIFSNYYGYNSASASTIAHELGHAIDFENFLVPQKKRLAPYSDCFLEVPSVTMAVLLKDYLRKEHIDVPGSMILDNLDMSYLRKNANIIKTNMSKNEEEIGQKIAIDFGNKQNGIKSDDAIRDGILYGVGAYFAYHLKMIRESSNEEFLKVFNNLMTLRKGIDLESAIELTGIDKNDFVSGKYIKPQIKENNMELKKRYKL